MRQGRYCIVCGTTDWSVVQYTLPNCPERRAKWLSILKVDPCYINSRSRVCSKHFARNQLIRNRLKSDALPKPLTSPIPRSTKNDDTKSKGGGIWQDKINLNGRCVFCLEKLKSKPTLRTSTSLAHLWPYLQLNQTTAQDFYFGKIDNDNQLMFSQIPPMCSPCLQNINILNTLHHELEEIKAKVREQEKLVNSAAGRIREVVGNSVRSKKRNILQEELAKSKIPASCISRTTNFLDSLLPDPGNTTVTIINLTPQITIEESQDPIEYVILNSTPTPDQHNLETNCIVNNYTEDLTLGTIPLPAEEEVSVYNVVLVRDPVNPVNVKTELPEETETVTIVDPIHANVKTELDSDSENEMVGLSLSSQTHTVPRNVTEESIKNKKRVSTSTITSQQDKRKKICDSDYDEGNYSGSRTSVSYSKSYPINQISFLPEDEQLIDVPRSPHLESNDTTNDTDPFYNDPLGDT